MVERGTDPKSLMERISRAWLPLGCVCNVSCRCRTGSCACSPLSLMGCPPKVPPPPRLLPSQSCLIWSGGVRVWHVHRVLRADDAVSVIDLLVVMSHPAPAGGVSGRSAGLRYCGWQTVRHPHACQHRGHESYCVVCVRLHARGLKAAPAIL